VGLIVVDIDVPSPLSIGMGAINLARTVGGVNAARTYYLPARSSLRRVLPIIDFGKL
jgi:hypothetical protein